MPLPNERWRRAPERWMSKRSGSSNLGSVAVGRTEQHQHSGPLGDHGSLAEVDVGACLPPPHALTAGVEPESFLDSVGDQRRLGTDLGPLVGVLCQQPHCIGQQVGGGLVAGDPEPHDDAGDLGLADRLVVGVADVEQGGGEVVGPVDLAALHVFRAVLPQRRHVLRHAQLLALVRVPEHDGQSVPRPTP